MDFAKITFITKKFFINSKVLNINSINSGLINKTYLVEHLHNGRKAKFILQSLSNIFESHEIVNNNHKLITDHIKKKINNSYVYSERWEIPDLIRCESNKLFGFPFESDYWRAMVFIEDAFSFDILEDEMMAYQTGLGLSKFHLLCSDLDCSKLVNSIRNFHDTRYYIDIYFKTIKDFNFNKLDKEVIKRIENLAKSLSIHIEYVDPLLTFLSKKSIENNVIHGDPKLNNFLFDIKKKYVVSMIDLDTVTSGCLLTDLADCIRSVCNLAGEDPKKIENTYFDIESFKYLIKGYFSINNKFNKHSFIFLPEFIYLIIFELTIRFFTDFLQSNRYFKVKYETHNLFKAEAQHRLLSSFLLQISNLSNELHEVGIFSNTTFLSDVQKNCLGFSDYPTIH
tara:strand:+ start:221 stop:1408 length:1188 start_codon:yes stop_codon:yes gene_type:complete